MKTCKRCLQTLPLTDFHKKLTSVAHLCKTCTGVIQRAKSAAKIAARPPKPVKTTKWCNACKQELPFDAFQKKTGNELQTWCKDCRRAANGSVKLAETIEEYFWRNVTKGALDECWEWQGARFTNDYGKKTYGQGAFRYEHFRAHRKAWELFVGPIPEGLEVCHTCDNPPCCNYESHLFLGTVKDNAVDSMLKGRKRKLGKPRKMYKLTIPQILRIKELAYSYSAADLAGEYGVHVQTIYDIWQGRRWSDII